MELVFDVAVPLWRFGPASTTVVFASLSLRGKCAARFVDRLTLVSPSGHPLLWLDSPLDELDGLLDELSEDRLDWLDRLLDELSDDWLDWLDWLDRLDWLLGELPLEGLDGLDKLDGLLEELVEASVDTRPTMIRSSTGTGYAPTPSGMYSLGLWPEAPLNE